MSVNKDLLQLMGKYLNKKDQRTIGKLKDIHPLLYDLFNLLGKDRLQMFLQEGTLGEIEPLLQRKESMILEYSTVLEKLVHIDNYILETTRLKMDKFYRGRPGGLGLKKILNGAFEIFFEYHDIEKGEITKSEILSAIQLYDTTILKLEVPNHKKILSDFIERELVPQEIQMLVTLYKEEKQ